VFGGSSRIHSLIPSLSKDESDEEK
jgi:hypothetical protein